MDYLGSPVLKGYDPGDDSDDDYDYNGNNNSQPQYAAQNDAQPSPPESSPLIPIAESDRLGDNYTPDDDYHETPQTDVLENLRDTLKFLGFRSDSSWNSLSLSEQQAVSTFVTCISSDQKSPLQVPQELDDLNDYNPLSLTLLFNFSLIKHPAKDLFIFHSPRPSIVKWSLGVMSARVALYVCRHFVSNPASHMILTIAHRLLERGVPCCTLISYPSQPNTTSIQKAFTLTSLRPAGYKFSPADLRDAMTEAQAILAHPEG
ncbi:hypothetical protein CPB84DRAFT_1853884 [Gymnopilus junonius]|uniref:Uncharacterized protein n=1 Tax=Gymnopilus junonius TaxID=109634 RepID=A0A9P5TG71_GYMJU|nr:hypothetical protein CPB84DRAFT_1853884 [Gymnopilus junonius]